MFVRLYFSQITKNVQTSLIHPATMWYIWSVKKLEN